MISYEERTKDYEQKIALFKGRQAQPYEYKRAFAKSRIEEFI